MQVQFNTDNSIEGSERQNEYFTEQIKEKLGRFSQITRVEAHLKDVNGAKHTPNDKSCTIEVRLEGMKPMAATNNANTEKEAVSGAIDKMKSALDRVLGKLQNHH